RRGRPEGQWGRGWIFRLHGPGPGIRPRAPHSVAHGAAVAGRHRRGDRRARPGLLRARQRARRPPARPAHDVDRGGHPARRGPAPRRRTAAEADHGRRGPDPVPRVLGLYPDLYELTMAASFHRERRHETVTFDLFVRSLPPRRDFLVVAGIDTALER